MSLDLTLKLLNDPISVNTEHKKQCSQPVLGCGGKGRILMEERWSSRLGNYTVKEGGDTAKIKEKRMKKKQPCPKW